MPKPAGAIVHFGIILAYAGIFFLMALPATMHPADTIWGGGGDTFQFPWSFAWQRTCLSDPDRQIYHTELLFYPAGADLHYHDLSLLNAGLSLPLQPFLGLIPIYNLLVLLHSVLSGWAMYLLVQYTVRHRGIAFFAGFAFAFCPYRIAHLHGHLSLLATEWIPLFFYCLLRMLNRNDKKTGRWWWSFCAALCFAAAALSSYYYAVILAVAAAVFLPGYFFDLKRLPSPSDPVRLGGTAILTFLILMPAVLPLFRYYAAHGAELHATDQFTLSFSADPRAYLLPSPFHPLWKNALAKTLPNGTFHGGLVEGTVTPGYTLSVLGLAGFIISKRSWRWRLTGLIGFILSLGPVLMPGSMRTHIPLPYAYLEKLPLMNIARVPARFSVLVTFSLVLLASRFLRHLGLSPRFLRNVVWTLMGISFFECWFYPCPMEPAAVPATIRYLAATPDRDPVFVTVMDSKEHMYYQAVHGHPVSTGSLSRRNPADRKAFEKMLNDVIREYMRPLADTGRKAALARVLHRYGFRYIWTPDDYYLIPEPTSEDARTQLMRWIPFELVAGDRGGLLFKIFDSATGTP